MTDHYRDSLHNVELAVKGKCICEACNCGKHHCPRPYVKGQFCSSYCDTYKKPDGVAKTAKYNLIQKNYILPTDKFQGASSYTNAYDGKDIDYNNLRAQVPKRTNKYQKKTFQGMSTYTEEYLKKQGQAFERPQKMVAKDNLTTGENKFQGKSSYNGTYENRGQGIKAEQIRRENNQILPQGKFSEKSTYGSNYLQKDASQRAEKFRPIENLSLGGKFQDKSSYNSAYVKSVGQRAEKAPLPQNQVIPKGQFSSLSTYKNNFNPLQGEAIQQYRPQENLKVGEGSLECVSSYNKDFLEKRGEKADIVRHPSIGVLPKGQFQGNSTYNGNYRPEMAQRSKCYRPEGELTLQGNFQGSSSYQHDYYGKEPGLRAQSIKRPDNDIVPQGVFEGNSTYQNNYIPGQGQKAKLVKQAGELNIGFDEQFQGSSSYCHDFQGKESGVRAERVRIPNNQILPKGQFQDHTCYKHDFIPGDIDQSRMVRPKGELGLEQSRFQGSSSYKLAYTDLSPEYKQKCPCDELKAPRYQKSQKEHLRYNIDQHQWK